MNATLTPMYTQTLNGLTVAQLLLKYLKLEGVSTIFGVPGGAIKTVLSELALDTKTFTFVVGRQETGAAFMAKGYARLSGLPGVIMVTSGPGATNAITGVKNSHVDNHSRIAITGETPEQLWGKGFLQEGIDGDIDVYAMYQVHMNTWLASFDETTLADGSKGVELIFKNGREPVKARALFLALPRRSLELLTPTGPVLDPARAPHFRSMLGSVMSIPLYKMFIGYNYPWWESMGVSQGRSFTDLPIRQCYYCGKNATPSPKPDSTNAVIMAYDDSSNVDFWGGLRMTSPKHAAGLRDHPSGFTLFTRKSTPEQIAADAACAAGSDSNPFAAQLRKNWVDHAAPSLLVAQTHCQLMLMHNAQYAPDPVEAAYADWSDDPYGGADHLWNRGFIKSCVLVDDITHPVGDFPCYICGDAYSTAQTWAEGALETAEIVLQKRLGLEAPDCITPNQTLPPKP